MRHLTSLRYIDAVASWWVNLHGHGHKHIARAVAEQAAKLEQVIFAGFTHEPAEQLAAIEEFAPDVVVCWLMGAPSATTGATAIASSGCGGTRSGR